MKRSHPFVLLSALLGAGIAFELAHIIYLQVATFHPLPYLDEWRTMILFSRAEQEPSAWSLLLVPHAEHRPLLPRLVFLLDTKLAQGTGAFSLAIIDALLLGLAAVWAFLLTGNGNRNDGTQLAAPYPLALCIAVLLFSGHQMSNFVRAFQVAMLMVCFFAMLSFAAFASAFLPKASVRSARSLLFISLSCFFGVCAAFSMGNGLIVLPILFVIACVRRREFPPGTILIIGIVAAAALAAYLAAPGSVLGVLGRTDYKLAPGRAVDLVDFFLAFLGGPWASVAPGSTTIIGLVTLLSSLYAIVKYRRLDRLGSYDLVSVGLIALTLISAAATALARLRFGIEAATESRYSTSVLMLYAALVVSFWPRVHADAESAEAYKPDAVQTGALVLFALISFVYGITSHRKLPYDYSQWRDVKENAEVAYVADVQDPVAFKDVAPQPQLDLAWQARGYVLRHKLSVFSTTEANFIGRPLTDIFTASDECIGHLDQVDRTVAGVDGGFRVTGWAWDTGNPSVPRAALLVEDGIVKGIGRFTAVRPDVVAAIPEVRSVKNGFVGYVPRGVAKVTAYVLDRDESSVCRIPGDLAPPSG